MKKLTKFILAIAVASSVSTSTLFAQEGGSSATTSGTNTAMNMRWVGWLGVGATIGGVVAVAVTANKNTSITQGHAHGGSN